MKLLWLGPEGPLGDILKDPCTDVVRIEGPISESEVSQGHFDFAISYRYRHIIRPAFIGAMEGNIINLHISFLPWNRGADPNLWSFLEDTPKGVSIHWVDAGIDTGPLIAQKTAPSWPDDTLGTMYARLDQEILSLLEQFWPIIRLGHAPRFPQLSGGSFHRSKDKDQYLHLLTAGWNTPVFHLTNKALGNGR